jgi:DHA2 family multidrug resistance protein
MTAPAAPAPIEPLKGFELALGTFALSLATFLNVLTSSIANVSLPAIAGDLGATPSQGTWVITSFGMATAISMPLTGWLVQRFGQVRLFTASVTLFVIGSWLCGLAPNLESLIAFRILQGAVAGPLIPVSQTLLLASYPPAQAGIALALWSMTTLVAPIVGPLLGGWITDNMSWSWIFYINVPIGVLTLMLMLPIYRSRETVIRKLPVDVVGMTLLVVWVGSLQMMLDLGKERDWFSSTTVVMLAIVCVISLAAFLIWELTDAHPVVDLTLLLRRNFWTSTLALALTYGIFFGNAVMMPLWLQQQMGYTATMAGAVMAPVGVFAIFLMPLVGRSLQRIDPRLIASMSLVVFAIAFGMRSLFSTEADLVTLMLPSLVQGIAVAMFFVPLNSILLAGLPPDRLPAASGLSNFMRTCAGAFGTSLTTTLWADRTAMHHEQLVESIAPGAAPTDHALATLGAAGFDQTQSLAAISRMVDQQGFTISMIEINYASSAVFLLLIGLIWIARPPRPGAGR